MTRSGLLGDAARELALGTACVGCGRPGRVLCRGCDAGLPRRAGPTWPSPVPTGLAPPYAAGEYGGVLRAMVNQHKEHGVFALATPWDGCWRWPWSSSWPISGRRRRPGGCGAGDGWSPWCRCRRGPRWCGAVGTTRCCGWPGRPPSGCVATAWRPRCSGSSRWWGRCGTSRAWTPASALPTWPGRCAAGGSVPTAGRPGGLGRGGRRRAHHRVHGARGAAGARGRRGAGGRGRRGGRDPPSLPAGEHRSRAWRSWAGGRTYPSSRAGATVGAWSPSGSVVASGRRAAQEAVVLGPTGPRVRSRPASRCQSQAKRST